MQTSSLLEKNLHRDENVEAFVVQVTSLNLNSISIHPAQEAQIALLVIEEIKIPTKYSDFSDVFSKEKALILPKITKLNQHAIELQKGQQPPYRPIYSLDPIKLETLKTYIKTNLVNGFIWSLKLPVGVSILFVRKLDGFLHPIWPFQISSNAIRIIQCSGKLPRLYQ